VRIGDISFVPVDALVPHRKLPMLEPIWRDCAQVFRSYRDGVKHSISRCVLAVPDDWTPRMPLSDATTTGLARAANMIMLAAFSANTYGHVNSWCANAQMFQLDIAVFTSPPGYVSISHRRRDGISGTAGARWGYPLFFIPRECAGTLPITVDRRLAKAVGPLYQTNPDLGRRLALAMPLFGLANTDSTLVGPDAELIMMAAAFDALLDTAKAKAFANRVAELMNSYGSVRVSGLVKRDVRRVSREETGASSWLHYAWADEFYTRRNMLAHGKDPGLRQWTWEWYEHLAMGSFIFPLLVKLVLAGEGIYELTWDDKARCDAVDTLLSETEWFFYRHDRIGDDCPQEKTRWSAVLARAGRSRYQRESSEVSRRLAEETGHNG